MSSQLAGTATGYAFVVIRLCVFSVVLFGGTCYFTQVTADSECSLCLFSPEYLIKVYVLKQARSTHATPILERALHGAQPRQVRLRAL